jgi:hypothetical protein
VISVWGTNEEARSRPRSRRMRRLGPKIARGRRRTKTNQHPGLNEAQLGFHPRAAGSNIAAVRLLMNSSFSARHFHLKCFTTLVR